MKPQQRHRLVVLVAAALTAGASVTASAQAVAVSPAAPSLETKHAGEPRFYEESLWYSAKVERRYVVGYAPKKTSLFLNPREFRQAVAAPVFDAHFYRGSMDAYCWTIHNAPPASGMPSGSPALAYHRGESGITGALSAGYPQGKRVVEPVLVPYQPFSRKGGVLIVGAPTAVSLEPACQTSQPSRAGGGSSATSRPPLEK